MPNSHDWKNKEKHQREKYLLVFLVNLSPTFCHCYHSRAALLCSEGATSPELLLLRTLEMVGLLRRKMMQPSHCLHSQTCLRVRMAPSQHRTQVWIRLWSRLSPASSPASPQTADRTSEWSFMVHSRRAFQTQWTCWKPPYMSQMWCQDLKKPPWTPSLTMAPMEMQAIRRNARRNSQEGETALSQCVSFIAWTRRS